jgi:endoglycosylceramidase
VRLGVIFEAVEPRRRTFDNAYLTRIKRTVDLLGRHGIYSLLDFHQDLYAERFQGEGFPAWAIEDDGLPALPKGGFPGNYFGMPALEHAFDNFWANNNGLQDAYADAWGHVAARFAKDRYVLGYDLMNEPWPGTPWATCANPTGCRSFDAKLSGLYARAIRAIRGQDRRHLVFYEPNVLFNSGAPTNVRDTGDRRAAMSFHDYCLGGGEQACKPLDDRVFANADQHARSAGDALLLTEFGATDDATTLTEMADRADSFMIGWQEWHYCPCADPTTTGPGTQQALVVDPAKPPRGANVETAKLALLARPHPEAIAGTPTLIRSDPASHRFTLRYTTRRPSGRGRVGRRAVTRIVVPRLQYPHGYRVRVRGGRVRSRRNARILRVSARRRQRVSP